MSGTCDLCGEHCLECVCSPIDYASAYYELRERASYCEAALSGIRQACLDAIQDGSASLLIGQIHVICIRALEPALHSIPQVSEGMVEAGALAKVSADHLYRTDDALDAADADLRVRLIGAAAAVRDSILYGTGEGNAESKGGPRFFIDHGMIHDRVTGKHVTTEPIEIEEGQFDTSPVHETCALLNALAMSAKADKREGRDNDIS